MRVIIYLLHNTVDHKFYVGSTSRTLVNRFNQHKRAVRKNCNSPLYQHMRLTKLRNWKIKQIDSDDLETYHDQLIFERMYYDHLYNDNCLNSLRPHITIDERREDNKQTQRRFRTCNPSRSKELIKTYYLKNREKIYAQAKLRIQKNISERRYHCFDCDKSFGKPSVFKNHNIKYHPTNNVIIEKLKPGRPRIY